MNGHQGRLHLLLARSFVGEGPTPAEAKCSFHSQLGPSSWTSAGLRLTSTLAHPPRALFMGAPQRKDPVQLLLSQGKSNQPHCFFRGWEGRGLAPCG